MVSCQDSGRRGKIDCPPTEGWYQDWSRDNSGLTSTTMRWPLMTGCKERKLPMEDSAQWRGDLEGSIGWTCLFNMEGHSVFISEYNSFPELLYQSATNQVGVLKQQKCVVAQFQRLEVWHEGVSRSLLPLKVERNPSLPLPSSWWCTDNHWCSLVSRCNLEPFNLQSSHGLFWCLCLFA